MRRMEHELMKRRVVVTGLVWSRRSATRSMRRGQD